MLALEHTAADEALLPHVTKLASLLGSDLLLVHVADGWEARNFERLNLAASEEMKDDWRYLQETAAHLRAETSLSVDVHMAIGHPPEQIVKTAEEQGCDLIAMTSHGHRLLGDLLFGSTIDRVRHGTRVPILAVHVEGHVRE